MGAYVESICFETLRVFMDYHQPTHFLFCFVLFAAAGKEHKDEHRKLVRVHQTPVRNLVQVNKEEVVHAEGFSASVQGFFFFCHIHFF